MYISQKLREIYPKGMSQFKINNVEVVKPQKA